MLKRRGNLTNMGRNNPVKQKTAKSNKCLTVRQSRIARILSEHSVKSRGEAAIKAGYSSKNPDQSAYQAIEAIKQKAPEVMAKLGLTLEHVIQNHLVPLMGATETKIVVHEGKITDYVELSDNTTRRYSTRTALELLNAFPPRDPALAAQVGVEVIVMDMPRPKRPEINVTPANGNLAKKEEKPAKAEKPDPRPRD
jgi:hypothetical protein